MSYYGCCVTADGKALITKLLASKGPLVISGVKVGKGKCPDSIYPGSLHDLIDPVADGTVTAPVYDTDTVHMTVQYRNDLNGGLTEGFYLNEFGVYADDLDNGQILLFYGSLGDEPEYVRSYTAGAVVVRNYPISITICENADIQITINSEAWITAQDMAEYVAAVAATRTVMDFVIPAINWQKSPTSTTKYPWYADVHDEVILASHIPDVALDISSLETACDAGLCPTVQTYDAGMRFYAQGQPDADITGSCVLWGGGTGTAVSGGGSLPIASSTVLGGVKIGPGLNISEDGTLSTNMATDAETDEMIHEVFTTSGTGSSGSQVATDAEVNEMITEVYGEGGEMNGV